MSIAIEGDRTDVANILFKVEITGDDGSSKVYIATTTAINSKESSTDAAVNKNNYARTNPANAALYSATQVEAGVTYNIKVIGQEMYRVNKNDVTVGTFKWRTYRAFSSIRVDYISEQY